MAFKIRTPDGVKRSVNDESRIRELEAQLEVERAKNAARNAGEGVHMIVEKTAKKYKLAYIAGWLMVIGGCVGIRAGTEAGSGGFENFCAWMMIVGVAVLIVTKIRAWWHHG